jgi:hypothetical protein
VTKAIELHIKAFKLRTIFESDYYEDPFLDEMMSYRSRRDLIDYHTTYTLLQPRPYLPKKSVKPMLAIHHPPTPPNFLTRARPQPSIQQIRTEANPPAKHLTSLSPKSAPNSGPPDHFKNGSSPPPNPEPHTEIRRDLLACPPTSTFQDKAEADTFRFMILF